MEDILPCDADIEDMDHNHGRALKQLLMLCADTIVAASQVCSKKALADWAETEVLPTLKSTGDGECADMRTAETTMGAHNAEFKRKAQAEEFDKAENFITEEDKVARQVDQRVVEEDGNEEEGEDVEDRVREEEEAEDIGDSSEEEEEEMEEGDKISKEGGTKPQNEQLTAASSPTGASFPTDPKT